MSDTTISTVSTTNEFFTLALVKVFQFEGGYGVDAQDPGDYDRNGVLFGTNYGISTRAYPDMLAQFSDASNYPVLVKDLSKNQAGQIYRTCYWDAAHCDSYPGPLAMIVFDSAVNSGVAAATYELQTALVSAGYRVQTDGRPGPKTAEAAQDAYKADPDTLLAFVAYERLMTDMELSNFGVYKKGWTNRILKILISAVKNS